MGRLEWRCREIVFEYNMHGHMQSALGDPGTCARRRLASGTEQPQKLALSHHERLLFYVIDTRESLGTYRSPLLVWMAMAS